MTKKLIRKVTQEVVTEKPLENEMDASVNLTHV